MFREDRKYLKKESPCNMQRFIKLTTSGFEYGIYIKTSEEVIIAAAGTSCRHQIKDGISRDAMHPVEILLDAIIQHTSYPQSLFVN